MRLPHLSNPASSVVAQTEPVPGPTQSEFDGIIEDELLVGELAQACGTNDPGPFCTFVYERTGNDVLARLAGDIFPGLFQILLIVLVAYFANRLLKRVIRRFIRGMTEKGISRLGSLRRHTPLRDTGPIDLARATMRTETVAGVLRSVATFLIWAIAFVMALGVFNVNLGPLIASAGIVGIALGFGAQNLVKDFLSGIFMILEDQYGIGDIVDVGEAVGVVEAITLRTTRLRDLGGTVWYVPNGEIRRVGNKSQQWARAVLDIGIAYHEDVAHASGVMKGAADEMADEPEWAPFFVEPAEVWGVESLAADAVTVRMVAKVAPKQQFTVERELRARIKRAFDEEGIEIPFPQRTLWIRQDGEDNGALPSTPTPDVQSPAAAQDER